MEREEEQEKGEDWARDMGMTVRLSGCLSFSQLDVW